MIDFIEDDSKSLEEPYYISDYKKKFKKEPFIIGMFWNDEESLIKGIEDAIKSDKPYNEYELLTDEEKQAYDAGELFF